MFNCSKSPYICYRDKYPCKVSEKKFFFSILSLSKMVNMIQESWQLTKILCNSGPHCTWVLYPSQGWYLFNIFRVYLWKNTQRYIENNVCSSKQKGCTLLSMIFLCYLLGSDSPESKMSQKKRSTFFFSNQNRIKKCNFFW